MDTSAFDFAADTTRELIKYSAAILTLTITFAKDTFLADRKQIPMMLGASWLAYLLAIVGGIWTLLALTGSMASEEKTAGIWGTNIVIPSGMMALCFMLGIIFTAIAGWQSVRRLVAAGRSS